MQSQSKSTPPKKQKGIKSLNTQVRPWSQMTDEYCIVTSQVNKSMEPLKGLQKNIDSPNCGFLIGKTARRLQQIVK